MICSTSPNARCCVGWACSTAASHWMPARRCAQTTTSPATRDLDLITSLVDKSLVLVVERESSSRYALLETVRQHALDRLAEAS